MKLNAYTIYDVASGAYMRPFFTGADGQAIRSFRDIATDADHEVGRHPQDYTLYRVGGFEETTGELSGGELIKLITGLEAVSHDRQIQPGQLEIAMEKETNGTQAQTEN